MCLVAWVEACRVCASTNKVRVVEVVGWRMGGMRRTRIKLIVQQRDREIKGQQSTMPLGNHSRARLTRGRRRLWGTRPWRGQEHAEVMTTSTVSSFFLMCKCIILWETSMVSIEV
jgi:hypothetical protein